MLKKNMIVIYLLFFVGAVFGQNRKIDSLQHIIQAAKEDTTEVNCYTALFNEYEFLSDSASRDCLNKAIALAKKIDFKKGLALANIYSGYFMDDKGKYPEAMNYYQNALTIALSGKCIKEIASAYNCIGSIFYYQGDYPEALKNYYLSLKMDEKNKSKIGVASSYNNIGLVYEMQGNYPEALKHYENSLSIKKALNDKQGMAASYNNIGDVYNYQAKFDEALLSYFISMKMRQELGDKAGVSDSYNNIGVAYYAQGEHATDPVRQKKLFDDAAKNFNEGLTIRKQIADTPGIASSNVNLGNVCAKLHQYPEASSYLDKALKLTKQIGSKVLIKDTYSAYADLDSMIGDFKGAYENYKLFIVYSDSLNNEETRKKTVQSQMTYDFDKKEAVATAEHKKELENQQMLADEKSRRQRIVLFLVLGFLFLVLIFALFILKTLRTTRKQKVIIEHQKELVEEKQKEILDSIYYARRIQNSLLPTEKYIEKHLKK